MTKKSATNLGSNAIGSKLRKYVALARINGYEEDHPRYRKCLITMVIVSPLRIGLWNPKWPFYGLHMGVILTTYPDWDDPPSTLPESNSKSL